jgi:hypothetical protein
MRTSHVIRSCGALALAALLGSGCASMFIHGGRLVNRGTSVDGALARYQIQSCRDASGGPGQQPDATYYVLQQDGGPELLERSPNGQGVLISNRWEDAQGTHYFAWGVGLGWEFTLPHDGSPAVRLGHRRPGSSEEADGTRRPVVSQAPESTCTLVLVEGSPPGAGRFAAAPPVAQPLLGAPTVPQPAVVPMATSASPPPAVITTSAPATGACAAGRVETPEGFCCLPGQHWDTAARECAGTATPTVRCAEGRTATSEGYCCWPGQTFDRAARVCAGPPRCPAGFGASGEDCVAVR